MPPQTLLVNQGGRWVPVTAPGGGGPGYMDTSAPVGPMPEQIAQMLQQGDVMGPNGERHRPMPMPPDYRFGLQGGAADAGDWQNYGQPRAGGEPSFDMRASSYGAPPQSRFPAPMPTGAPMGQRPVLDTAGNMAGSGWSRGVDGGWQPPAMQGPEMPMAPRGPSQGVPRPLAEPPSPGGGIMDWRGLGASGVSDLASRIWNRPDPVGYSAPRGIPSPGPMDAPDAMMTPPLAAEGLQQFGNALAPPGMAMPVPGSAMAAPSPTPGAASGAPPPDTNPWAGYREPPPNSVPMGATARPRMAGPGAAPRMPPMGGPQPAMPAPQQPQGGPPGVFQTDATPLNVPGVGQPSTDDATDWQRRFSVAGPPTPGATPASASGAGGVDRSAIQKLIGEATAPEDKYDRLFRNLMAFGASTAAAGGRPGASFLGSVGQGAGSAMAEDRAYQNQRSQRAIQAMGLALQERGVTSQERGAATQERAQASTEQLQTGQVRHFEDQAQHFRDQIAVENKKLDQARDPLARQEIESKIAMNRAHAQYYATAGDRMREYGKDPAAVATADYAAEQWKTQQPVVPGETPEQRDARLEPQMAMKRLEFLDTRKQIAGDSIRMKVWDRMVQSDPRFATLPPEKQKAAIEQQLQIVQGNAPMAGASAAPAGAPQGAGQPGASQQNPVRVQTPADASRLPSGTWYTGPDGIPRRRG